MIFDKILSGTTDNSILSSLEQDQSSALLADLSDLCVKRPKVCAEGVDDLKRSMAESRRLANMKQEDLTSRFSSKISSVMQPPMSETEIISARDKLITEILGSDTNPAYVNAFKAVVEPHVISFRKVFQHTFCSVI